MALKAENSGCHQLRASSPLKTECRIGGIRQKKRIMDLALAGVTERARLLGMRTAALWLCFFHDNFGLRHPHLNHQVVDSILP